MRHRRPSPARLVPGRSAAAGSAVARGRSRSRSRRTGPLVAAAVAGLVLTACMPEAVPVGQEESAREFAELDSSSWSSAQSSPDAPAAPSSSDAPAAPSEVEPPAGTEASESPEARSTARAGAGAGPVTAAGKPSRATQAPRETTARAGRPSSSSAAATFAPKPGGPFIAYSPDSFFRRPLPAVTPVSPNSAAGIAYAKQHDPHDYLKIRGAHGVGWGIAYAEADCDDPIYRITSGKVPDSQKHLTDVGFHAPASLWKNIPPNADAPFLVIDRCGTSARPAGLSVWGAGTSVSGQSVKVGYAGSFSHDSNGLDRRNPASDSDLNERSRGVIPDSMAIRVDLLDHAIRTGTGLGHVLEVFWVETDSAAGHVSPMVGSEGGKSGFGAEGQRFRLKPGIDLAARPGCSPTSNPVGLAIARTLQQHGAYIGDNSGSGSGIKTEQNANYPGLDADSLQGCMTWDDLEFLPPGYGG